MVAGHLREKRGIFHIVLNYSDSAGKRKTKWISTGLPVKGNKKKAEALLMEARQKFDPDVNPIADEILFADYLEEWLEITKHSIQMITYSSYYNMTKGAIAPYFREREITLKGLLPKDIQGFYAQELGRVKASTVIHYHAVIRKALQYAVKTNLIQTNPADKVERPKMERFTGSFYDSDDISELFEAAKGSKLELPVMFAAFYGLRRSEVVGLKWDAIDFTNDTLSIRHTVTVCNIDGKNVTIASDSTKTKSSMRTLPLVPMFKEKLLAVKAEQEANRKLCGRSYNTEYLGYICVDEMGTRISPNYVTAGFASLLEKNGLRKIRYHDLRHSCASLLLANGVPMKQIQEWLGHSDFSTTANIYAHLDYNSKVSSANALIEGLKLENILGSTDKTTYNVSPVFRGDKGEK